MARPTLVNDPEHNAWCSRCQKELPKEDFHPSNTRSTGLSGHCKSCDRDRIAEIMRKKRSNIEENN